MSELTKTVQVASAAAGARDWPPPALERRLLVVDDEEVVCQIVQGFLGVEGWDVDSVGGIEEAMSALTRRFYPVILCDVHLPGDSTAFLRTVKSRYPSVQVVMFTGDPTINTVREALQHGAYEYVPKPCRREEIVHITRQAFEKYLLLCERERLETENEAYRKRLEELVARRTEQLRESELRYRSVFNRAVDAILLVNYGTGTICECNIAATRLLGISVSELAAHSVRDFFGNQLDCVLAEAREPGHHEWRLESLRLRDNGGAPRTVQVSVGKVELDNQACLQIVVRDVTEQWELARQNEQMEMELLNEQRLAAIGLLASGIAHNINTPLMGIYGAAQLVKMKHPEIEDIDDVLSQVERINGIIRNLMWKSRQEQETRQQEINLNQLLQEELRFLEADLEFKHNVQKHVHLADDVPTIMGRYGDFSQSIINVVRNALDAMHDRSKKQLYVTTEVRDGEIRIVVRDTGCGIARDDLDKIFVPFYSTKPVVSDEDDGRPTGTGIGLSTVQKLLTPYGARFDVVSEPTIGTTFTMCIPIAPNKPGARPAVQTFES